MKTLRVDDVATTGDGSGGRVEDVGGRGDAVAEGAPDGRHFGRRHFGRLIRLGCEAAATASGKIAAAGGGGGAVIGNGGEVKADNVLVDPPLHSGKRLYEILLQRNIGCEKRDLIWAGSIQDPTNGRSVA